MNLLRVTLRLNPLSPSWLFNPSWNGRVGDWIDSFQGSGWAVTCTPTLSPTQAIVYVETTTGAEVTSRQLPGLFENWSQRIGGVAVKSLEVVPNCGTAATDDASINRGLLDTTIEAVGGLFGEAGKALAVPLTLALLGTGIYLVIRYRKGAQ